MSTLGAAVVGLGVGEQHARAYARDANSALTWLLDHDPKRTSRLCEELGEGRAAADFDSIVSDGDTSIVSLASYDDDHFAQVLACLGAGKHVFVEKPLCRSLEEARSIRTALNGAPKAHLVSNLILRSAPLYRWLRAAISRGELGEVYAFDGDYLYGRLSKITGGWRKDVEDYSVMQGGGVHLVDLMMWVTGQKPERVTAVGNRVSTAGTAFQYDDFVAATYRFPSGMVGRITANFGCVHRHHHVLRVFGTEATFIYDDQGPRIHRTRDPEAVAVPVAEDPLPANKGDLIPDFISSIREERDPRPLVDHELAIIAATVASDEALASSNPIDIDYP